MEDKIEWLIILLIVLALIIYVMMALGTAPGPKPAAQQEVPPAYSALLRLSANPSYSNAQIVVSGILNNCGAANATLRLDGKPLEYQQAGNELTATIRPVAGTHQLSFESGPCKSSLLFETLPPACANGQSRACDAGRGCPGIQTCQNNFWGSCRGPARICNPGQKVSCAINSCVFGTTVCNACGTGWSICTAPQ